MNEQDQRVRDYYQNLNMSEERLSQLLEAGDASEATPPASSGFKGFLLSNRAVAAAACIMVLLVSVWIGNSGFDDQRTEQTLREVALNHTTRLQPEFHGETLAKLDNSMHQLPFALVMPDKFDETHKLIGSRYCSLGGILAAHVKLQDKESGKAMSLFVTSNASELKRVETQQTSLDGVDVKFWREGGLFFALAQRSS